MRKTIEVTCSFCNKIFPKDIREFNRNKNIGRKNFCSLICTGKASGRWAKKDKSLIRNFKGKTGTRPIDEFSPFRHYLGQIKQKCKDKKLCFDVDLKYLKETWQKQNGLCPYTGWNLVLPKIARNWPTPVRLQRASVDRVDSDKGYLRGNIQFVCPMANWGKSMFPDKELINFCKLVSANIYAPKEIKKCLNIEDLYFLKCLRLIRKRKHSHTLSLKDLKRQWKKQKGLCAFSGLALEYHKKGIQTPRQASLDRIDSSKGYTSENIQFICLMANLAKNTFSNEDLIDFCKAVACNHSQTRC